MQVQVLYRSSAETQSLHDLMRSVYEGDISLSDFSEVLVRRYPLSNAANANVRQTTFYLLVGEKTTSIMEGLKTTEFASAVSIDDVVQHARETLCAQLTQMRQKLNTIGAAISIRDKDLFNAILVTMLALTSKHNVDVEIDAQKTRDVASRAKSQIPIPSGRSGKTNAILRAHAAFRQEYEASFDKIRRAWVDAVLFAPGGAAQKILSKQQTRFGHLRALPQ